MKRTMLKSTIQYHTFMLVLILQYVDVCMLVYWAEKQILQRPLNGPTPSIDCVATTKRFLRHYQIARKLQIQLQC